MLVPSLFAAEKPNIQEGNATSGAKTEIEAETAGILPTSPFYFIKDIVRGVRRILTVNPISRVEYEVKVASQKAAELRKIEELDPTNSEALKKALANYSEDIAQLNIHLSEIKETSDNPRVDLLLNKVAEEAIKHQNALESLKVNHLDIKNKIEEVQGVIDQTLIKIPEQFDNVEKFRSRMKNMIEAGERTDSHELNSVIILNRLEEAKPTEAIQKEIRDIKTDLFMRFEGKITTGEIVPATLPEKLSEIRSVETNKLKIIDEIREGARNSELKNELNTLRPQVIKQIEMKDEVNSDDARASIDSAKDLISKTEEQIKSGEYLVSGTYASLLEKARFNIGDAESLFRVKEYSRAFAQANSATAALKTLLSSFQKKGENLSDDISNLKLSFDSLKNLAIQTNPLVADSKLADIFNKAEKMILRVQSADDIRAAKVMFAEIESLIKKAE